MKTTYNNWMMLAMSLLMTTATTTALTACSNDDPVMEEQMPTMLTGGKPMLGDDATKRAFLTDWENCYTGVLRVFHYIEKATGYGDELVYLIAGSESRKALTCRDTCPRERTGVRAYHSSDSSPSSPSPRQRRTSH